MKIPKGTIYRNKRNHYLVFGSYEDYQIDVLVKANDLVIFLNQTKGHKLFGKNYVFMTNEGTKFIIDEESIFMWFTKIC